MSHAVPNSRRHIAELDGLRAIAIALVFLHHFGPHASPITAFVKAVGWAGVDLFFVLSGFLIGGILLETRASPSYYRDFYIRRALRIFPLYYLLLTLIVAWLLVIDDGASYHRLLTQWGSPWWEYAYLGNIRTAFLGLNPDWLLVPFWSLHVEEQFYLLAPFAVRRVSREMLQGALIVLIVLAPCLRLALVWIDRSNSLAPYMLLPCRMDALAWGMLLATQMRNRPWAMSKRTLAIGGTVLLVAAVGLFALGGAHYDTLLERTLGYSLFDAAFAAVILWIVRFRGGRATQWLTTRPFQFVGRVSYGFYLLHIPVAVFTERVLAHFRSTMDPRVFAVLIAGGTLAAAGVSYQWFEHPILMLKGRFAPLTPASATPATMSELV